MQKVDTKAGVASGDWKQNFKTNAYPLTVTFSPKISVPSIVKMTDRLLNMDV